MNPQILRGAELLDKEQPGWEHKISVEDLDMGSNSYCILGQLFGSFVSGIETLFGVDVWGEFRHFSNRETTIMESYGFYSTWGYHDLQEQWLILLKERTGPIEDFEYLLPERAESLKKKGEL